MSAYPDQEILVRIGARPFLRMHVSLLSIFALDTRPALFIVSYACPARRIRALSHIKRREPPEVPTTLDRPVVGTLGPEHYPNSMDNCSRFSVRGVRGRSTRVLQNQKFMKVCTLLLIAPTFYPRLALVFRMA